jgi:diacylglycerol kinase (ATP)
MVLRAAGCTVHVTTRKPVDHPMDEGDVAIACGGDGTVHAVLQVCMRRDLTLGVLPCGRGNDIARALRLQTISTRELAQMWLQHPVAVDVAAVEPSDEWFLGVLTSGFDSRVNARANRQAGGYAMATLRELASFGPTEYDVVIDDRRVTGPALLVSVGNGGWYGGGMHICPTADLADGALDITWVDPTPVSRFIRLFPSVFRGTHATKPEVRLLRGTRVHLNAPGFAFADGEPIGELPVTVTVQPAALRTFLGPS